MNRQVEVTNCILVRNIKRRPDDKKGLWVEELQGVLWAYRMTMRDPIGETPFALAFGLEAIIPVEVGIPSYQKLRNSMYEDKEKEKEEKNSSHILLCWYGGMYKKDLFSKGSTAMIPSNIS